MTRTKPWTLAAAVILALAGCTSSPAESLLDAYGLAGLDGREMVDRLDRTPVDARQPDLVASVRPGELLLSKAGSDQQLSVDLPDGEFYLAIAPYLEQTHECYFHSLTTCTGELAGEQVHVTIIDRDSGEVIVDEVTGTFDNGFAGFWLPSGIEATIQVEHDGYSASQDIATGPDDPTCLSTLQLA